MFCSQVVSATVEVEAELINCKSLIGAAAVHRVLRRESGRYIGLFRRQEKA